jgi:hypothetical protein
VQTRAWGPLDRIIDALPSYLADAWESPRWLLMFAFARFVPVRRLLRRLARPAAARTPERPSALFPALPCGEIAERIDRDGLWIGLRLPSETVADIRDFATHTPCYGNFDRRLPFLASEHAAAEARYGCGLITGQFLDDVEGCGALRAIRADAALWRIAKAYLRTEPIVITTRLWWSFPSNGGAPRDFHMAGQERFHFDLDDWRSVKFFFYVTDVDLDSGPHVVLRGSHRFHTLAHQISPMVGKTEAEVVAAYGRENVTTVLGPAGLGFAEDPFAFHMGKAPRSRPRLMAEVEFGVSAATRRRFYGDLIKG